MQLRMGPAGVQVQSFAAKLFAGDLTLSGGLTNGKVPALDVDFGLTGASVAQALQTSADLSVATGTLQVSGKLQGKGRSQKAIVASLQGAVDLSARKGVVQGVDMVRMSETMLTLVEYDDFIKLLRTTFGGGETRYENFHAPFVVKNGVATTGPALATLEASEATVNATVDLPRWQVDADVDFRLTDPGHEETPSVGMRLHGPIDDPEQTTRAGAMTAFISRRLANRLIEDFSSGNGGNGLRELLGGIGGAVTGGSGDGNAESGGGVAPVPPKSESSGDAGGGVAPVPPKAEQSGGQGAAPDGQPPANPFDLLMQGLFNEIEKDRNQAPQN